MNNPIDTLKINQDCNIRNSVKQMDLGGIGFIAIVDNNENIIGVITDGDFRRAILSGISLEENILKIVNKNFKYVIEGTPEEKIFEIFQNSQITQLPVLKDKKIVNILFKKDYQAKYNQSNYPKLHVPVVIMAGGKGTRLAPFTDILPKPLIPIGNKTIIETIIDEYSNYGINDFYISVNYKAKLIKAFFEEEEEKKYNIIFINETIPLGTAGALRLIEKEISDEFFVSNCDIIIKDNYANIYDFHKKGQFDITLVASMQHHIIPYGVCKLDGLGVLTEIIEKPEYDFLVNTGMYILNKKVLSFIPKDTFYHITHLIEDVKKSGGKIGVYPVSEKSWIDIGQWEEYNKALNILTF